VLSSRLWQQLPPLLLGKAHKRDEIHNYVISVNYTKHDILEVEDDLLIAHDKTARHVQGPQRWEAKGLPDRVHDTSNLYTISPSILCRSESGVPVTERPSEQ
jgi:hypothetical protein